MGAEFSPPATLPAGAEAAYQMDGDNAPIAARFGSVLSMANGSAVFPQAAMGDAQWDAQMAVDGQAMRQVLDQLGDALDPEVRNLLAGQVESQRRYDSQHQVVARWHT